MFYCCTSYVVVCLSDTATTEIYTHLPTLSLHDALPIYAPRGTGRRFPMVGMYSFHSGWKPIRRSSGGKRSLDGRGQRVVTGVEDEDCKQLRRLGLARVAADRVCRVRRFGPALAGDRKSTRLNSSH